jgi:hypothetical protein
MDVSLPVRALRRWWPVVVIGVILTAMATVFVASKVPERYSASGSVVLLHAADRGKTNPYATFDSSLLVTSDALLTVVNSDATKARLQEQGADPNYTVVRATTAPFLTASVTTTDEAQAVRTVRLVLQAISDELVDRQERIGADPQNFISADSLTVPTRATVVLNARVRAAGAVVGLGLVLTFSAAILCELASRFRASGRKRDEDDDELVDDDGLAYRNPMTIGPRPVVMSRAEARGSP